MKLFYFPKRKRKQGEILTGLLFVVALLYSINILSLNPFFSVKNLIFCFLLIMVGQISVTSTALNEDKEFFSDGDRQKNYIISNATMTVIIMACMIVLFLFLHLAT